MSPGDTAGRSGRVPADSLCFCIAIQAVPSIRPPRYADLCLPSHAKPSYSHHGPGSGQGMGKRLPYSLGSSLHGGISEEWGPSLPTSPSDPPPLTGGCGPPSLLRLREEKRRMRCLRMRIQGWKLPQLNFKNPWLVAMVTKKVHPIAMATGKHQGLLLGLGIWEVAGGSRWRRLSLGWSNLEGGVCYPAWDHLPPHFQKARLGAFSWQWGQRRKYCQE